MSVRRVLLVCSGNTCRSPMAAALLHDLWRKADPGWNLEIFSAGTAAFPGCGATDHAAAALRRRGLDISAHRSRTVTDESLAGMDLVLTMTNPHKEHILRLWPELRDRLFTLGEYAGTGTSVPDPFGGTLPQYEQTAEVLLPMLRETVARICREGKRAYESGHWL